MPHAADQLLRSGGGDSVPKGGYSAPSHMARRVSRSEARRLAHAGRSDVCHQRPSSLERLEQRAIHCQTCFIAALPCGPTKERCSSPSRSPPIPASRAVSLASAVRQRPAAAESSAHRWPGARHGNTVSTKIDRQPTAALRTSSGSGSIRKRLTGRLWATGNGTGSDKNRSSVC